MTRRRTPAVRTRSPGSLRGRTRCLRPPTPGAERGAECETSPCVSSVARFGPWSYVLYPAGVREPPRVSEVGGAGRRSLTDSVRARRRSWLPAAGRARARGHARRAALAPLARGCEPEPRHGERGDQRGHDVGRQAEATRLRQREHTRPVLGDERRLDLVLRPALADHARDEDPFALRLGSVGEARAGRRTSNGVSNQLGIPDG